MARAASPALMVRKEKGGHWRVACRSPDSPTPERENLGKHPIPPPPFGSFTVSMLLWDGNLQSLLHQLRPEGHVPTPGGLGSGGKD